MSPTFYLVLATCAVGAAGDQAGCPCSSSAPATAHVATGPVRTWFRNRFGPRPQPAPVCQTAPPPVVPAVTTVTTLRANYQTAPPQMAPPQTAPPTLTVEPEPKEPSNPLQVAKEYENKIGHAENYDWVTGHLFYVHSDGGRWVVRYALPDETDKYGGSVVLAPGVEMRNYREGDLVCVYGEVLQEGRSSRLGGPLYRANVISIVERSDP